MLLLWGGSGHDLRGQTLIPGYVETGSFPDLTVHYRWEGPGRRLQSIDPGSFHLAEDGIPMTVSLTCPPRRVVAAAVGFGLELSLDDNFSPGQRGLMEVVSGLRFTEDGHRGALFTFSTFLNQPQGWTRDSAALQRAIDSQTRASWPFNGTALYESLYRAIGEVAGQSEENRAVVYVTTGVNNTKNYDRSRAEVRQRAVESGVAIYILLVGDNAAGREAMEFITSGTGGEVVDLGDEAGLHRILDALRLQPLDTYWCTAQYRSPHCANGASHALNASVVEGSDTVAATSGYVAPYRPGDLRSLSVFISPERFHARVGDTLDAVVGFEVGESLTVPVIDLELRRRGAGPVLSIISESWLGSIVSQQDTVTRLRLTPQVGPVLGQGRMLGVRVRMLALDSTAEVRLADAMGPTGCVQPRDTTVATSASLELDTLVTDPGIRLGLDLSVTQVDLPEGISSARFVIRIADSLLPELQVGQGMFLAPRFWQVTRDELTAKDGWMLHSWEISGPPLRTPGRLAELLFTLHPSARRIPVYLDSLIVNRTAPVPLRRVGDGLILVRDSCENNIVLLSALAVSSPWPHPATDQVRFLVVSVDPRPVSIDIVDALGRLVQEEIRVPLSRGRAELAFPLAGMRSGWYLARFRQGEHLVTRSFVIP